MYTKRTMFIILLLLTLLVKAQNCSCERNFNWVKETFEKNDAGFAMVLKNKGQQSYDQHNNLFRGVVGKIDDLEKCRQAISKWLEFFRSGHIGIKQITQKKAQKETIEYKHRKKVEINLPKFKKYLDDKKQVDFEGVWESKLYDIVIKKVKDKYIGFILKGDGVYWFKNQVKFKIHEDNSVSYYKKNHSLRYFEKVVHLSQNFIEIGTNVLKRKYPVIEEKNVAIEKYFKVLTAKKPYFEIINKETVLLRIPSFSWKEKEKIDSVIIKNKDVILKTPNLILDIRNNGGGSDVSFSKLLPFLYTNPIRTVGVEFLSTRLNNQRMLDILSGKYGKLSEKQEKRIKESYDKLSKHIGKFVMLNKHSVTKTVYDTIYNNPKNVGIIINEGNGSTAEQFLLAAKQSRKVKLFGKTTAGVLDVSNMYFINSPCNEFKLSYCLSKSKRIPEMSIDGKGIQPDYFIDNTIPNYKWITFVTEILRNK